MPDGEPPVYDPNTRRAPLQPVTPHAGSYGVRWTTHEAVRMFVSHAASSDDHYASR